MTCARDVLLEKDDTSTYRLFGLQGKKFLDTLRLLVLIATISVRLATYAVIPVFMNVDNVI